MNEVSKWLSILIPPAVLTYGALWNQMWAANLYLGFVLIMAPLGVLVCLFVMVVPMSLVVENDSLDIWRDAARPSWWKDRAGLITSIYEAGVTAALGWWFTFVVCLVANFSVRMIRTVVKRKVDQYEEEKRESVDTNGVAKEDQDAQ